jgi:hypothetical protein
VDAENALVRERVDQAHLAPHLKVLHHAKQHAHLDARLVRELLE